MSTKRTTRVEYRYDPLHQAYEHLQREADRRGMTIQKTINEAVLEWWAWKQGGGQVIMQAAPQLVAAPEAEPDELREAASDFAEEMM